MKIRQILLSFLLLLSFTSVYADDLEQDYIKHFATLSANADKLDLWPGFQINGKPFIIGTDAKNDADRHLYAFNLSAQNPEWQLLPYNNNKPIYYLSRDVIGFGEYLQQLPAPYFKVDGQDSLALMIPFAYCQPQEICDAYIAYNLIQKYEFYQSPYAQDLFNRLNQTNYYPYDEYYKPESLALLFIENEILLQYLKTQNQEDLKDYVAIYQQRSKRLEAKALSYEETNPWARLSYVMLKFLHPNTSEILPLMGYDAATTVREVEDPTLLRKYTSDSLTEFSVPTVELALDGLEPDWRQLVESNQATPNQILIQHFHLSDEEVNSRYLKSIQAHGYEEKLSQIHDFVDGYLKNMSQEQANYQGISGVEFEMPMGDYVGRINKEFLPNNMTKLLIKITDLNGSMDRKGKTNIYIGYLPYLYYLEAEGSDLGKFKLSLTAQLKVDGVEVTVDNFLKQKSSLKFHDLEIRDKMQPKLLVEISTGKMDGYVLEAQNDRLVVRFLELGSKPRSISSRSHSRGKNADYLIKKLTHKDSRHEKN